MQISKTRKTKVATILAIGLITGYLVLFSFARIWNKTDKDVREHINKQLVKESVYGGIASFCHLVVGTRNRFTIDNTCDQPGLIW